MREFGGLREPTGTFRCICPDSTTANPDGYTESAERVRDAVFGGWEEVSSGPAIDDLRRRPPDDCDGRRRCGLLLLSNACRGTRFDRPLDGACPRRWPAMPLLLPLLTLRWLAVGVIGPPKLPTPAPLLCALTILPVPTLPATANVRADTNLCHYQD